MAASQAAHEGSIPFTRFSFASAKEKRHAVVPRLGDEGGLNSARDGSHYSSHGFPPKNFLKGWKSSNMNSQLYCNFHKTGVVGAAITRQ